jgi:hypothetical protein
VHCPELAPEAIDSRVQGRNARCVPEHVVEHGLIPFIPAVEVYESEPETLAWILDFDPPVRTRRRV